jgi:flagellar assembly factor FliW
MASEEIRLIESRLGAREVRLDKVIHFPRGIIGFDSLREFTLLQIRPDSPLLVLQSMEEPTLGLLVADPFAFISDYDVRIGDADQELLKAGGAEDIAVLVTATIPPGRPERTALNLLGPIVINHRERLGLQVPQNERTGPARIFVHMEESE